MPTSLEKLVRANRWRIRKGTMTSEDTDGWNGCFLVPLDGQLYHVMIGDGMGWKHLSVTNAQYKKLPDWPTMCRVKELFYGDDEWAVQFMPAREDNINDHPFCLHIWAPIDVELPKPSIVMV